MISVSGESRTQSVRIPNKRATCEFPLISCDKKAGAAAEQLHRQFLKRMLGLRDSIADVIVLAECGHFPLQFHYWQQILRYHNRANKMSDTRLVRCAFLDDMQHTLCKIFAPLSYAEWKQWIKLIETNC